MDTQESVDSCGKAIVRVVAKALWPKSFGDYIPVREDCSTFLALSETLSRFGVNASGFKDLKPVEALLKGKMAILQLARGTRLHFVLLMGKRGDGFSVYDPAYGAFRLGREELDRWYTGNSLVLTKGQEPAKGKERIPTFKAKETLALTMVTVIRAVFGTLFIVALGKEAPWTTALFHALGFFATIGISFFLNAHFLKSFQDHEGLAFLGEEGDGQAFAAASRAKTESLRFISGTGERAAFLFGAVVLLALSSTPLLWAFVGTVLSTGGLYLAFGPLLTQVKARSGFYEEGFLDLVGSERRAGRELQRRSRSLAFCYAGGVLFQSLATAALIVLSLLFLYQDEADPRLEAYVSSFIFLEGCSINLSGLFAQENTLAKVRLALYGAQLFQGAPLENASGKCYSLAAGNDRERDT